LAKARRKVDPVAALAAVSEADVKQTLDQIGDLQASMQGTLAGLGATMVSKIEELGQLNTAIDVQKDALKELHDIEVQAETLAELEEREQERLTAHEKAAEARALEWAEQDAARLQLLTRESEQAQYQREQREKRALEEFNASVTERQRQERFRMEDVNRQMSDKIEAVEAREAAVSEKEEEIAAFPAKLEAAVAAATEAAETKAQQAFGHERTILKKDAEGKLALAHQQIQALEATIRSLQDQLEAAENAARDAQTDAKEISQKAVEASADRQALTTLQKAMEVQASAPQKR